MNRLSLLLDRFVMPVLFTLLLYPVASFAGEHSASRSRQAESYRSGETSDNDKRREREKRSIIRMIEELRASLLSADEELKETGKELEAITLLESPQREKDFISFRAWYYSYTDWLSDEIWNLEEYLELLSTGSGQGGRAGKAGYDRMLKTQDDLALTLEKLVKHCKGEQKRLARILDRQKKLRERYFDLENRRTRIEKRTVERSTLPQVDYERQAERLMTEMRIVQNELLALSPVDEDILKHYAVLAERGLGEIEWLSLKRSKYEILRDLAAVNGQSVRQSSETMIAAYRKAIHMLEGETGKVSRKTEDLDRKRSRMQPAGSLKEVERSREIGDYYERLHDRYDKENRKLRVLIGAWNAELAEVMSEK